VILKKKKCAVESVRKLSCHQFGDGILDRSGKTEVKLKLFLGTLGCERQIALGLGCVYSCRRDRSITSEYLASATSPIRYHVGWGNHRDLSFC